MIRIEYRSRQGQLCGFCITGHAGAGTVGNDIICAAVSSAAYMAANTLTDVLMLPTDTAVSDGRMELTVSGDMDAAQPILSGFRMHIEALHEQYPDRVQLTTTEV